MNKEKYIILLVDNEPEWFEYYKGLFENINNDNLKFYEAETFEKAKDLITIHKFDLAFVDYRLYHDNTSKSGLHWTLLYKDLKIDNIPIIAVSKFFDTDIDILISMINNFKVDAVINKKKTETLDNSFIVKLLKIKKISSSLNKKVDVFELYDVLDEKFSVNGLNKIISYLEIDSKHIKDTTKNIKIINLLKYCENNDLLVDLLEVIKRIKPDTTHGRYKWDVFLSYSSKDFPIIEEIKKELFDNDITCWIDDEQIKPGDRIISQLEKGIDQSHYVIACFSENQLSSSWSRIEYESVLHERFSKIEDKITVIPLIIDDLDPEKLPRFVKGLRHIKLSEKREFEKLIRFLKIKNNAI